MDSNLLKTEQIHVVLGPVASDDFPGAVVAPDGEGQAQHMVGGRACDSQDAMHPHSPGS